MFGMCKRSLFEERTIQVLEYDRLVQNVLKVGHIISIMHFDLLILKSANIYKRFTKLAYYNISSTLCGTSIALFFSSVLKKDNFLIQGRVILHSLQIQTNL